MMLSSNVFWQIFYVLLSIFVLVSIFRHFPIWSIGCMANWPYIVDQVSSFVTKKRYMFV